MVEAKARGDECDDLIQQLFGIQDRGGDPANLGRRLKLHSAPLLIGQYLFAFGFGQFTFGDVARNPHQPDDLSPIVAQWHLGRGIPARLTCCIHVGFFMIHQRHAVTQNGQFGSAILFGQFARVEIEIAFSDKHFGCIDAVQSRLGQVDQGQSSLWIFSIDVIR